MTGAGWGHGTEGPSERPGARLAISKPEAALEKARASILSYHLGLLLPHG